MGLMKSRLDKNEEEFKNDLGKKSKIEFVGSKYKDRMFIKLSKNRKKIRTAAIEKDWPVTRSMKWERNGKKMNKMRGWKYLQTL